MFSAAEDPDLKTLLAWRLVNHAYYRSQLNRTVLLPSYVPALSLDKNEGWRRPTPLLQYEELLDLPTFVKSWLNYDYKSRVLFGKPAFGVPSGKHEGFMFSRDVFATHLTELQHLYAAVVARPHTNAEVSHCCLSHGLCPP